MGAYQDYRRNFLDAYVGNVQYETYSGRTAYGQLTVGAQVQYENIYDRYKEWQRIDSAGFSVPHSASEVDSVVGTTLYATPAQGLELFTHVSATQWLENVRGKACFNVERSFALDRGSLELEYGARLQWAQLNGEVRLSPRAQLRWKPEHSARSYAFNAGVYDQYPFYRELRRKDGTLDETVKSQQALHMIARTDKAFRLWDRPFVWSVEGYYKHLRRTNLYGVENVRIRYAANNDAVGRVYGIDSRINGEFVEGTDSWFTVSLFRAQEQPLGDSLWYARPTDTRFNFAVYFQDHLPNDPSTRMSLTLMMGGSFPFGPDGPGDGILPPSERLFRSPPYRRADLSLIKVIHADWTKRFEEVWVSLDIFNLLQARNTISYLWIKDASTARQYAVPNYMTTRLMNVKVHVDF